MALAFDANSDGGATGTSVTVSHTVTGTNTILLVGVGIESVNDWITGVTYNGDAMTLLEKRANDPTNNEHLYLFYLINPDSGTHDIVVSSSNSVAIRVVAASYTGAKQSGQPDAEAEGSAPGISHSINTNVVASNCWVVSVGQVDGGGQTAGAGVDSTRDSNSNVSIGDSDGTVSTGNYATEWTCANPAFTVNIISASIAPVPDTGAAFILTMI